MKKAIFLVSLIALTLTMGFVQELVKININYHLDIGDKIPGYFANDAEKRAQLMQENQLHMPYDYYHNHASIRVLHQFSQGRLVQLKWVFTFLFVAAFLVLNLLVIHQIHKDRQLKYWTILLYLGFFLLSFVIYLIGKVAGHQEEAYAVSRKIVGALQSLVPLMLILPGWWIFKSGVFTNEFSNEKIN
jgi:threonine/homoserine/homoserine lactone efflux protein